MKSETNGMILLTTLCALSIMACMWLSLIHVLFLFRKVTHELERRHFIVKTLEDNLQKFVLENSPDMLEECLRNTCTKPSGVIFQVKKIVCSPCLHLDKEPEQQGTQHWDIRAKLQGKELAIRWVTPALCGVCEDPVVLLRTPMLSWSLYP